MGENFPLVRVLRLERNLGFGAANNLAARSLPGQALLLLNPDAVLVADAAAVMLRALADNPRRGAISPRIDRPDGTLDAACRRSFPTPLTALWPRHSRLAWPNRSTPITARGRSFRPARTAAMRSARCAGSIWNVRGSTSTNTGVAPSTSGTSAVAV